jgi:hypothetical protein
MSPVVQAASIAAWNDEAHVVDNRELYRAKFAQVTPLLASVLDVALPDAGFYLWAGCAQAPARASRAATSIRAGLLAQYNVTVLPGSYLAREASGSNPGAGRIRMALVAETGRMPGSRAAHRPICPIENLRTHERTTAADHRRRLGNRASLSAKSAPKEVRDAVEHVIAELNAGKLRVATRQAWASGRCTSGSRRPCC